MRTAIVRFISSPPLHPDVVDDIGVEAAKCGAVLIKANDADLNASTVSIAVAESRIGEVLSIVSAKVKGDLAAGRAFRFDVMPADPSTLSEEAVRTLAVALHGALEASVHVGRRDTPAAAWALLRPMPWGRKGLAVGQVAPSLPFGGSACLGVAIEVGAPTVIVKARLEGVPEHAAVQACAAIGGSGSGFADVAAYPGVSAADGTSVAAMEFSDIARSPIHRSLAVLDIEARRYGGCLGQTALLSHLPLTGALDVLRASAGLDAQPAHVLETHLPREAGS